MTNSSLIEDKHGINRLVEIVRILRSDSGCPWDREQTLDSLKQYFMEECYELLDAIDSGSAQKHEEELGDVLMHVLLQAQIRNETGDFDINDVAERISEKLIRRHPHVFSDTQVTGADDVLKNWEAIKAVEKKGERDSVLDGVPGIFPPLMKAQKLQTSAARVGFDWTDIKDVVAKVQEELDETVEAISGGNTAEITDEIGDLLFSAVNIARFMKIDSQYALNKASSRFIERFKAVEKRIKADGREIRDCTLAELDVHWEAVKKEIRLKTSISETL